MERHWSTKFVHPNEHPDPVTGSVVPPLYRAVSYHQADPWNPPLYDYARSGNPSREGLETAMARLEHGARGLAFASGSAALTAIGLLFSAGDHVIITADCQGGTQRLFRDIFSRFQITTSYVDTQDPSQVASAILPNTRAILVENFSNPYLKVSDIATLSNLARRHQLLLVVDNTMVTPALQTPLDLGADAVVHSATKAIAGHADVTAGVVVTRTPDLGNRLYRIQNSTGMILSPDDAYTVLRGLRTLPVRMERVCHSAEQLAQWLETQSRVATVYYPGLPQHPGYQTARTTMRGFGQVVTFRMASPAGLPVWVTALQLIQVGAGFGSTESMISLPPRHCHAALTPEERHQRNIGDDLIRLSVGLEDVEDLKADLEHAWNITELGAENRFTSF